MIPLEKWNDKTQEKYSKKTCLREFEDVLVRVFIPAQTSWKKNKLGRKGFIWLTLPYCCSSPRKSGLELKQVRKQELMQRPWRDVLTGLPHLACSACSLIEPKTTSPGMVPPTRGLSPLITNWENALDLDLMESFPSTEAPFSVITPAVSSWHKTSQYRRLCKEPKKLDKIIIVLQMVEYLTNCCTTLGCGDGQ